MEDRGSKDRQSKIDDQGWTIEDRLAGFRERKIFNLPFSTFNPPSSILDPPSSLRLPRPPKRAARLGIGVLAILQHLNAVYKDVLDAYRVLMRVLKRSA